MRALLIALQFLTILPVRLQGEFTAQDIGRSLLFYPVVGLLIGIVLSLLGWNLTSQSPMVSAILVLAVWVTITGALHIDGLADSADAWLGGIGDKAKTLSIMKDPAAGPIAVVTIVLVLLIKFVMLTVLLAEQNWWALIWSVILARTALLFALLFGLLVFLLLRYLMERRLNGFTGDTAGAMVELLETALLIFFVLF